MTLAQCLATLANLPATVVNAPALAAAPIQRVHSDTRSLQPGDLFVALRGERFDAHSFLAQARAAGAVAALAEHGLAAAGLPGVEVPDSRTALGELASRWRSQFQLPLVAITGSNGKTTVTQMVASILRASVAPHTEAALATAGNFNNDIGVPLTLLRLRSEHRCAVVELGMNHPGEIAGLARMAQPTVALVNNAQREHQEFMATVEAVAQENASCFAALQTGGCAVFPANDAYTALWQRMATEGRPDVRTLTFGWSGIGHAPDIAGSATWQGSHWLLQLHTPLGQTTVQLQVAGRHNVLNALAAAACAVAAGLPLEAIRQGLQDFQPVAGRSRTLALPWPAGAGSSTAPATLVDDSYNANPDSVRAAIDLLAELPAPQLLVLGDMGEVGEQGLAFHEEVLRHAVERGVAQVCITGSWMSQAAPQVPSTANTHIACFPDVASLQTAVLQAAPRMASVLVKGSRFMRMERISQALQEACASAQQPAHNHKIDHKTDPEETPTHAA
jgi:UDP-N-acetylmuramoyl-tripeptide--D-alanyl-D-alanine ligase